VSESSEGVIDKCAGVGLVATAFSLNRSMQKPNRS
jgi:hypothetical protein